VFIPVPSFSLGKHLPEFSGLVLPRDRDDSCGILQHGWEVWGEI